MRWQRLRGQYPAMLLSALLVLIPYIVTTSAELLYREQLIRDLHATATAASIISGLSVAGYAFGAFASGDLINRFRQKSLFLIQCLALILGWSLSAAAPGIYVFGAGQVLAALATGMLLVTALPPIIRRFPAERLPITFIFINIAFFGAIAAGPLLGGIVESNHAWRAMFAGFATLDVLTFILAVLSLPHQEPANPALHFDIPGLALGFATTVLMFWASGELQSHRFAEPIVALPLGVGAGCFLALLMVEYHKDEPLAPIKLMWTTIPVVGTLIAMLGGGVFVTFLQLVATMLIHVGNLNPLSAGLRFWPQIVGTIASALLFGYLIRTRFIPVFILTGMLMLIAAGTMLLLYNAGSSAALRLAAMGALGLGAGATVSPALFLCGLPLQANLLGRIFALIELVRSAADFIIAPVMLRIARLASGSLNHAIEMNGFHEAIFITLMIAVAATAIRSACCYSVEQFCPFRTSTLGSLKTRRRSNLRRFLTV
jgi:MFS family permease